MSFKTDCDFSVDKTLTCGQCFRWEHEDKGFLMLSGNKAARINQLSHGAEIICDDENNGFFSNYLDLKRDYEKILKDFPKDEFSLNAISYGKGIRILRQSPWEASVSFIISQCNRIERIRDIIKRLCTALGEPFTFEGKTLYAFPSPEKILEADLSFLRAGYRDKYLKAVSRAVLSGRLSFDRLSRMSTRDAKKELLSVEGIGPKVADCILLYGMNRLDAFPIDTWMKKAATYYPEGLSSGDFGEYAGIAQQYIFFYARSSKIKENSVEL